MPVNKSSNKSLEFLFQGKADHNHNVYLIYHMQNKNINLFSFLHLCFGDISILPF